MEKKEKNSNVILLIVIAIATMVIVVIGATFAYLASSTAENGSANINAGFEGGGSDLLLIDAGKGLNVTAEFDTFGKGMGDQTDAGMAKVILQAAAASSASYKYDVFLDTEANDMVYTAGACYKTTTVVAGITEQSDCNGGNVWARVNGSDAGACYTAPAVADKIDGQLYESEQGCLTSAGNMWAIDAGVAELAFDIYKPMEGVTAANCAASSETDTSTTLGVCLDKQRHVYGTYGTTTKNECTELGYSWVDNYYDAETAACYKVDKSVDITTAEVGDSGKVEIYSDVEIAATDGESITHNYRVAVTLVNLPHNQIANGGHTYTGRLNIVVQPKENTPAGE